VFCHFCLWLSTGRLVTAAQLDGPMQKPVGNSKFGSLVPDRLSLWLKSWHLESLRFALNLVLNTSFHLRRNEPLLRRAEGGGLPLLPRGRCQPGFDLAGVGKERRLCASARCPQCHSCLPSPSCRASPYLPDGQQLRRVGTRVRCCVPRSRRLWILLPSLG